MKLISVVMIAVVATVSCQRAYPSINFQGRRQQPGPPAIERHNAPLNYTRPTEEEHLTVDPIGSPSNGKVIIRLASTLSTPAPAGRRQSSNDGHDGCSCESVDDCPVELMDFRFAVACDHGTVRCCRPVESNNAQDINDAKNAENVKNTVKIVTPVTLVKRPKKTAMCKCKPRKECDHFFHSEDAQDRKDNLCPSGMVRCCETGNMGNSKDDLIKGQTVPSVQQNLDNNQFKPVQLPFLKMPHPDTNIPPQELAIPADNTTHHKPKQPEMIGESVPVAPVTNKQPESLIPTTQQPFSVPPNHRQPQQQQFGPPQQVRPPVQAYQPLASNPGMNLPVRQPHRPMPNRPYMYPPPITQFGFNPPHQQPQQHFQPGGFGFSPINRPQSAIQQHRVRPVSAPTQPPQKQPKPSSSGGFLSSLMNIFN